MSESAQRFQRLQRLFDTAIELAPAERANWIAALPDDAQGLVPELQRLLQRDAAGDSIDQLHCDPVLSAALGVQFEFEMAKPVPATFGRFVIQGELGRGGMGRVFHGICSADGIEQHAAVKVLRPGLADAAGYARLQDEARALASLDHPGIARLLEAGTDAQGAPYVAMELVRGRGLLEACAQAGSGLRERLQCFRQVLAAVAHAQWWPREYSETGQTSALTYQWTVRVGHQTTTYPEGNMTTVNYHCQPLQSVFISVTVRNGSYSDTDFVGFGCGDQIE